jgi:hypothetical protein
MPQNEGFPPPFVFSGKRLLIDLSIIGALSLCQTWGLLLTRSGNLFAGTGLTAGSLVLAFGIGKALGARRGTTHV